MYGSGIPHRIRRPPARGPRVDLRTPHARLGLDHDGAPGFVGMVPSPWIEPRSSLTRMSLSAQAAVTLTRARGPSASPYGRSDLSAE